MIAWTKIRQYRYIRPVDLDELFLVVLLDIVSLTYCIFFKHLLVAQAVSQ